MSVIKQYIKSSSSKPQSCQFFIEFHFHVCKSENSTKIKENFTYFEASKIL